MALHGRAPPKRAPLGQVVQDQSIHDLTAGVRAAAAALGSSAVFPWNVRWWVGPKATGGSSAQSIL
eukprot:8914126-Alexandrium_andersonii.AAC.1